MDVASVVVVAEVVVKADVLEVKARVRVIVVKAGDLVVAVVKSATVVIKL